MPCCFDALSASMIEQAGFDLTFMSGFAVSATRLAAPDTGLISYGEMLDQGRSICGGKVKQAALSYHRCHFSPS
jgi:2-methylisocitrate lyase-like PEP mutase family enzyme